jgi:hypothetical protein
MKLSALNSTIRNASAVLVPVIAPSGRMWVKVQKTHVLEELKTLFAGDGKVETGMRADPVEGGAVRLVQEGFTAPKVEEPSAFEDMFG